VPLLCISRLIVSLTAAIISFLPLAEAAHAALLISVDKSAQRMTVKVDGNRGTFRPFRMEIDHFSKEWDNAPMPYSIFFTQNGDAIHGTYEQRSLGRAVSHGCVRLSRKNAATLWDLVKREKMANTTVVLTGRTPNAREPATVRSRQNATNGR
jgi:hypothetical protein